MGPPKAGKTCLQRALRHLPFTHQQQTHGLELHDILLPGCTLAHREVSLCLFSSPSVPLFLLTSCTLQTDLTLRVLDTGGQPAYHFLKPVVMRDRAVVLVCSEFVVLSRVYCGCYAHHIHLGCHVKWFSYVDL